MSDLTDELHDEVVRDCGCPVDREHVCNDLRAAVEAAFTEAVNAPSSVVPGLAVPYYRDVENIWRAIDAALSPHRCYDEAALAEAWLAGWLAYGDNESDAFQRSPDEVAESAREYARLRGEKP